MSKHNFNPGETIIRLKDKQIGTVRADSQHKSEGILILKKNWDCDIINNPNWKEWSSYVSLKDYREDKQKHMERSLRTGRLVVGPPGANGSFIMSTVIKSFSEKMLDGVDDCPYISFHKGSDSYTIPASQYKDYVEWVIDQYLS